MAPTRAARRPAPCAARSGGDDRRARSSASQLDPADPPACPEAMQAVEDADWVIFGPGSWFTSVLPHLLVPEPADGADQHQGTRARGAQPRAAAGGDRRLLAADASGGPGAHAPELQVDVVLADRNSSMTRVLLE